MRLPAACGLQDTLRFLVEESLQKYASFLTSACATKVTVHSTSK